MITRLFVFLSATVLSLGAALGQGATVYEFDGDFDDATFVLESEIIGAGLAIDYVANPGNMLARTRADVGSDVVLFDGAQIFVFCSAVLSRKVMEVNPANIAFCPYSIFVTDREGSVEIGFRNFPEGEMQDIQALLDGIVRSATDQ